MADLCPRARRKLPQLARRLCHALAALIVIGTGCSPRTPRPAQTPALSQAAAGSNIEAEIAKLVRIVAEVRGLPEKRPIEVTLVDTAAFENALLSHLRRVTREPLQGQTPNGWNKAAPALANIILGFYDWEKRVIFIQKQPPAWTHTRDLTGILAHEIVHALQDQYFDLGSLLKSGSWERRLATKALIEGDAELAAHGVEARLRGRSAHRSMLRAFAGVDTIPQDVLLRAGVASPDVLKMGRLERAKLLFQYVDGGAFAAALYRSGGFNLVNAAFTQPPETTQHIIHPEKYLAGIFPTHVSAPSPPPGFRSEGEREMGELATREILRALTDPSRVNRLVADWSGGTIVRLLGKNQQVITGWLTAWDTEETAETVAAIFQREDGPTTHSQREGNRLVVLRGMTQPTAARFASEWLRQPEQAKQPAPPLGKVELRPANIPPNERGELRGKITDNLYQSQYLGIQSTIPEGWAGSTKGNVQLEVQIRGSRGVFLFVDSPIDEAATPTLHRLALASFVKTAKIQEAPDAVNNGKISNALGNGSQWTWRFSGSRLGVQSTLIPACGGLGAWMFFQVWRSETDRLALESWLTSFKELAKSQPSPACSDVRDAELPSAAPAPPQIRVQ